MHVDLRAPCRPSVHQPKSITLASLVNRRMGEARNRPPLGAALQQVVMRVPRGRVVGGEVIADALRRRGALRTCVL